MIEEEQNFNENVEKSVEASKLQNTKNIEDLDDLKGIEGLKEVDETDEDDNFRPISNYLYNTQLDKSLSHYKDTEIAALDSGFCLTKGSLFPTPSTHIVDKCKVGVEYLGYIAKIKAREDTTNGKTTYKIRVVCHLIIDDEVAEFFKECSAVIKEKSEIAILLVKMGIPVFDRDITQFNLDEYLKHKSISATLKPTVNKKTKQINFYIDKINPRSV